MARRRKRREIPPLNLTAFLDVVFNLVFFFLVATTIRTEDLQLQMRLPASTTGQAVPTDKRVPHVGLLRDGTLTLNGEPIAPLALRERLKALRESDGISEAQLHSEPEVTLQQLIVVTDLCREAGIRTVTPRVRKP